MTDRDDLRGAADAAPVESSRPGEADLLAAEALAWIAASDAARESHRERHPERVADCTTCEAEREQARQESARLARARLHSAEHTDADRRAYREQQQQEADEERAAERARLSGLEVRPLARLFADHPFGVLTPLGDVIAAARTEDDAEQLARKLLALPDEHHPRGPLVLYVVHVDEQGKPYGPAPLRTVRRGEAW